MPDEPSLSPPLSIFSIGHSNHSFADFLGLLQKYQIEVLVDIRSQPYSKYTPHFTSTNLKKLIRENGLKYLFMGQELGGRPDGSEYYDPTGRAIYAKVAHSPLFLAGLERLQTGLTRFRVAIMCSEENPTGCHRHLLVSRVLTERGIEVVHIRGNGQSQTELALRAQEQSAKGGLQPSLFGDQDEELTTWKSLRSALPKKPRSSSSES